MATFTMQSSTYISCKVEIWEERIGSNTSRIHADAYYCRTNSWSGLTSADPCNAYITIYGQQFQVHSGYFGLYARDGWKWIGGCTKDVSHGDAINIGVSYSCDSYGGYFTCSGSGSIWCDAFYSAPTGVSGTTLAQTSPQRGKVQSRVNVGSWGNNSSSSYWVISKTSNRNPVSEWASSSSSNTIYWTVGSNSIYQWYAEALNNHGYATFAGPYKLSAVSVPTASATGNSTTPKTTLSSTVAYRGGLSGTTTEDAADLRSWRLYYKRSDQSWPAAESPQQSQTGTSLSKSVTFDPIPYTTFETGYNYHVSMVPVNSYGAWGDTSNLTGGTRILRCPQNVRASSVNTDTPKEALFTMTAGQAGGFAGESESAGYTNGSMWGYKIQYSVNADLSGASTTALTRGNTINITGLALDTTYYYRITGYNTFGLSNTSEIRSFKTRKEFDPQNASIDDFSYTGSFRDLDLTYHLDTSVLHAGGLELDGEDISSIKVQAKGREGFYDSNHEWVDPQWGTIIEDTSGSKSASFDFTMSQVFNAWGWAGEIRPSRLYGATEQQTYSGKNLCDYAKLVPYGTVQKTQVDGRDGFLIEGLPNNGTVAVFSDRDFVFGPDTYTISFDIRKVGESGNLKFAGGAYVAGKSAGLYFYPTGESTANKSPATSWQRVYFTVAFTQDTILGSHLHLYFQPYTGTIELSNFQIEKNSTPTDYEPYVGGMPSPNPDYPQNVTNTTVGNLELCQIGNYQDYVYKSGGEWYVHKEVEKAVLDGTQTGITQFTTADYYCAAFVLENYAGSWAAKNVISDNFVYDIDAVYYNTGEAIGGLNVGNPRIRIMILRSRGVANLDQMYAWLAAHPTTMYYQLATPTDTKITDPVTIQALDEWATGGWLTYFAGIDFRIIFTNTRGRELILPGAIEPPADVRASGYKRYENHPLQFVTNASASSAGSFWFTDDQNRTATLTPDPLVWIFAANINAPSTVGSLYSDQLSVTGLLSEISTGIPGDSIDYDTTYQAAVALTSEFGVQTRSPEFSLTTGSRTQWFLVDQFREGGVSLNEILRLATTSTVSRTPVETYYIRANALGAQPSGTDLRGMRLNFWTKPIYFREENVGFAMLSGRSGSSEWLLGYLQDPVDGNFKFGLWELPTSTPSAWILHTCFFDGKNWLMDYYDIPDEAGWVVSNWITRTPSGGSDTANGLRSSPLATTRVYATPLGEENN